METCDTCKFWGVGENPTRLRSCARWHKGYAVIGEEVADNEVLVEDDEGWGMEMGPKFGCVLHEPSTPAEGG